MCRSSSAAASAIFAIVSVIVAHSTQASPSSSPFKNQTDAQCRSLPGWITFAQSGIDIVNFDPFAPAPGWKGIVVEFTCFQNKSYFDDYTGTTYSKPDQIDTILEISGSDTEAIEFHADTSDAWAEQLYEYFSTDDNFILGDFSASESFAESASAQFNASSTAGVVFSRFSSYKVEMLPPLQGLLNLSSEAQMVYDNLFATTYKFGLDTVEKYEQWFKFSGTHYPTILQLGGTVLLEYFTLRVEEAAEASAELSANAKASFLGLLKAAGGGGGGGSASEAFDAATRFSTFKTFGGVGQPTPSTWAEWTKTIPQAPSVNAAKFTPIRSLLQNPLQRLNLQLAEINHYAKAAVDKVIIPSLQAVVAHHAFLVTSGDLSCATLAGESMLPSSCVNHASGCFNVSAHCPYPHYSLLVPNATTMATQANRSQGPTAKKDSVKDGCKCTPQIKSYAISDGPINSGLAALQARANALVNDAQVMLKTALSLSLDPIINGTSLAGLVETWTPLIATVTSKPTTVHCEFIEFIDISCCCQCGSCPAPSPHWGCVCPGGPRKEIASLTDYIRYPSAL